jgi:hypothetical protein
MESMPSSAVSSGTSSETRIDARLVRLEAAVRNLEQQVADLGAAERKRKQRALIGRVMLLGLLLAAYFGFRLYSGAH